MPEAIISAALIARFGNDAVRKLTPFIGRKVCSVASAATMKYLRDDVELGFTPSLPFVAVLAGAMLVAEWVKHVTGQGVPMNGSWVGDVLCGPATSFTNPMKRRTACDCVARRHVIDRTRAARGA
jgi:hypothetical protein